MALETGKTIGPGTALIIGLLLGALSVLGALLLLGGNPDRERREAVAAAIINSRDHELLV